MNTHFIFTYIAAFMLVLFSTFSIKSMDSADNTVIFLPKNIAKKIIPTNLYRASGTIASTQQRETALLEKLLKSEAFNDNGTAKIVKKPRRAGILSLLEQLKAQNPQLISLTTLDGKSLLHIAALHNYFTLADFLISSGAQVNRVDHHKQTPLNYADQNGHSKMVRLLLQHGATSLAAQRSATSCKQEAKQKKDSEKERFQKIEKARSQKRAARDFQEFHA